MYAVLANDGVGGKKPFISAVSGEFTPESVSAVLATFAVQMSKRVDGCVLWQMRFKGGDEVGLAAPPSINAAAETDGWCEVADAHKREYFLGTVTAGYAKLLHRGT